MKILIYRAIKTPDGTILSTSHRHDYKTHIDKITKELYTIDGGIEEHYRTSMNVKKGKLIELYNTDDIEIIREYYDRGTQDVEGNRIYVKLKDCSNEHIINIINYNHCNLIQLYNDKKMKEHQLLKYLKKNNDIYLRELIYRQENNIYIEDKRKTCID